MISEKLQSLILNGKAVNRIHNCGNAVNSIHIGRSKHVAIHSIHVQPIITTFFVDLPNGTISDVETAYKSIFDSNAIFTLTIYDNGNNKSVTFKNNLSIHVNEYQTVANVRGFMVHATSQLDFKEDCLWLYRGEQITIEISEIRQALNGAVTVPGLADFGSKQFNPVGFNNNVKLNILGANNILNPLGSQTPITPGQPNYNEFLIAKTGDGITGNILNDAPGAAANITLPVININLTEFNSLDYENL